MLPLIFLTEVMWVEMKAPENKLDAVLIDDDILVRMTWKFSANKLGKAVDLFTTPEEFFPLMDQYDLTTPIYVDAQLGAGISGEDVALQIHHSGFVSVFLCTGYPQENFAHLTWLRGVVGKAPPWDMGQSA